MIRKVLSESLNIKKGESIAIETWTNGLPFARQVVIEARRIGAIPLMMLEDDQAYIDGLKNMPKDVVGTMGKHEYNLLSATDAYVFIPGPPLGTYYPSLTDQERASGIRYNSQWYEAAEKARLRGARLTFSYIGKDLAKLLGKSVYDIVRHQLKAIVDSDFTSIGNTGRQISKYLEDGKHCTVVSSDGSKLEFDLRGDTEIEDGVVDEVDLQGGNNVTYVPPGFVTKKIDASTVTGRVKVIASTSRAGAIKDATLEFESGKLVRWESKASKDNLNKLVDSIAEESRLLSNVIIGLNPAMKFGYGQDRFIVGAVNISLSFRLTGLVPKGSLSVGETKIVENGKLVPLQG